MAGRFTGDLPRFSKIPFGPLFKKKLDDVLRRLKDAMGVMQGTPTTPTAVGDGAAAIGTSQTPANSDHVHPFDLLTTKGDLPVFTTGPTRLAIGTDGFVLTADSAQAAGMKWAAVAGGEDAEWMALNALVMGG